MGVQVAFTPIETEHGVLGVDAIEVDGVVPVDGLRLPQVPRDSCRFG